jgi:hypothetical protein
VVLQWTSEAPPGVPVGLDAGLAVVLDVAVG